MTRRMTGPRWVGVGILTALTFDLIILAPTWVTLTLAVVYIVALTVGHRIRVIDRQARQHRLYLIHDGHDGHHGPGRAA